MKQFFTQRSAPDKNLKIKFSVSVISLLTFPSLHLIPSFIFPQNTVTLNRVIRNSHLKKKCKIIIEPVFSRAGPEKETQSLLPRWKHSFLISRIKKF